MDSNIMDELPSLAKRYAVITPDNQGAVINILAWLLMTYMILAVIGRLSIKALTVSERFHLDDVIVVAAMLVNVGQVVTVSIAVSAGLGMIGQAARNVNLHELLQVNYASHILYFVVLFLTKTAALDLIYRLGWVYDSNRYLCIGGAIFIGIWAFVGIFVMAFPCGSTPTWDAAPSSCINGIAFWEAMESLNIITELMVIVLPIWLMWHLPMPTRRKAIACTAFGIRIVVVGAIMARMYYIPATHNYGWATTGAIGAVISSQCVLAFAIMGACIPVLRPFLDAFDSGMLGVNLQRQRGYDDTDDVEEGDAKEPETWDGVGAIPGARKPVRSLADIGGLVPEGTAGDETEAAEDDSGNDSSDRKTSKGSSGSDNIPPKKPAAPPPAAKQSKKSPGQLADPGGLLSNFSINHTDNARKESLPLSPTATRTPAASHMPSTWQDFDEEQEEDDGRMDFATALKNLK